MPMMRRLLLWTLLLPLVCAGFGVEGRAQSCSVSSVNDINFGKNIDILAGASIPGTGSVTVGCINLNKNSKVLVCIGMGSQQSPAMANSGAKLLYQIYTASTNGAAVGSANSENALSAVFTPSENGSGSTTKTLYAQILANQKNSSVGLYTGSLGLDIKYVIFSARTGARPKCADSIATSVHSGNASVPVTATITANCSIKATRDLTFPPQRVFTGDVIESKTALLKVTCTNNASYWVGLDNGQNPKSGKRRMVSGSNFIEYELFSDKDHALRWGNMKTNSVVVTGAGSVDGTPHEVYGRITNPKTSPAPGEYTDTITATVNF